MKKISIYLPEPLFLSIHDQAKYFDLKVSDVIRRRIESGSALRQPRRARVKSPRESSQAA